jgi:succinyl-CoA synthetase beta subunit
MDLLRVYGVRPSCFIDFGGGAQAERVRVALQLALANQPQALLINVFGGITRCDQVAQGIVATRDELSCTLPIVVRFAGRNARQGKEILAQSDVQTADSSVEAVEKIVELVRQTPDTRSLGGSST